jgi:hypothetical protein
MGFGGRRVRTEKRSIKKDGNEEERERGHEENGGEEEIGIHSAGKSGSVTALRLNL